MEVAKGHGIFVVEGSKCRLSLLADRGKRRQLGSDANAPLIDLSLHRGMLLWQREKRADLVTYLSERGLLEDGPFWKLAQALFEVFPLETGRLETGECAAQRAGNAAGRSERRQALCQPNAHFGLR